MVEFNYDYDYSDLMDGVIDDSVDTSYTPPTTDYSILGDAASGVGSGIANLFGQYANFIGPSYLGAAGFNPTTGFSNLEDLISSGALSASNMAGMADSSVYGGDMTLDELTSLAATTPRDEYTRLFTEYLDKNFPVGDTSSMSSSSGLSDYDFDYDYDFDIDDYIDSLFDDVDNTPGEGSGYDPRNGSGSSNGDTETNGNQVGPPKPEEKGFFSSLLSALGLGGLLQGGGGLGGLFGNLLGSMVGGKGSGNPLIDYLMMKSLLKDQPQGSVPIGEQAYGQAQPFNYQDYQPTKLQPALLPGVGYGNAPGMMKGGEAKKFPNKGLAALAKVRPDVVQKMGYKSGGSIKNRPGDITFAKLEPGEFVVRREAVDAVGIPTLEQINSMGG